MLCERCQERQANVHITQVVNGKRLELNLCQNCYQEEASKINLLVQPDFNIHSLLAGFLEPGSEEQRPTPVSSGQCSNCGLTYSDFGKVGQLGCSECYQYYAASLEPMLRRIHGHTTHVGKVPQRTGGLFRTRKDIATLRTRLQEAIAREAYEEAARLRDEIRRREKELG